MGFNIFTWWTGSSFGTWLNTLRNGSEVGRDAEGNIYFEDVDARTPVSRSVKGRRWVIYATDNDATRVPPEWHLWLHHTRAEPPSQLPLPVKAWEKPWRPNPTGSAGAELPKGALAAGGTRAAAAADYRPWTPGA